MYCIIRTALDSYPGHSSLEVRPRNASFFSFFFFFLLENRYAHGRTRTGRTGGAGPAMGPTLNLWLCACKTACLSSELLVSMDDNPHLWILHAKQRLLDQNNKSLWAPDITCHFLQTKLRNLHQNYQSLRVPAIICGLRMQNSDFRTRIACLYGSQASPVVLCMQNNVISTRITSLSGSQPSSVVLCIKSSNLGAKLLVSMGLSPHLWFCMKNRDI